MEVEYDLTPEDLIAFQRYHAQNAPIPQQRGGPTTALVGGLMFVSLATTALFLVFADNPTAAFYVEMIPFVVLGAALMLLGLILYGRLTASLRLNRAMRQGRNMEKFLGWRRVLLDAEAVRNISAFASSTYLWHGIEKVGATLQHAFLYINSVTAVVVPCRAFPSDQVFKDFVDAARHYQRIGDIADKTGGRAAWESPRSGGSEAPDDAGRAADDRIIRG
ncbi:MAG TPA: YcxB family protein [Gemmataceae bacterium]|nr:YcxB family protein [Gemmataceae bacterium]